MPVLLPYYVALAVSILLGISGQIMLKTGADRSTGFLAQFFSPFTLSGLFIYALAAAFYIVALKRIPVSLAFPSVSLSYVIVAVLAHFLWSEPLGMPQVGGILLIGCGIFLLHQ